MALHWGRFQDLKVLAQGGMGAVYRAYDPATGRHVALKIPLKGSAATPRQVARLRQEALALSRLRHPYVLPLHGIEEGADGTLVLVAPLVQGESLREAIERGGPLPAAEAVTLVRKIAEGVAFAHAAGVLHRDLKPDNVMLSDETGEPLLLDFGLARISAEGLSLTATGQLLGTPAYMAPEQGGGGEVGPAADVYGLGGVLYTCLSAQPPRAVESVMALLDELARGAPPLAPSRHPGSSSDRSLDAICARCLAHDPAERYEDVEALVAALRAYEDGERLRLLSPRRAIGLAVGFVVLVAIALAFDRARSQTEAELQAQASPPQPAQSAAPAEASRREVLLRRARQKLDRADVGGVYAAGAALVELDPKDPWGWCWKALGLLKSEDHQRALETAEEAVRLGPDLGFAYLARGLVRMQVSKAKLGSGDVSEFEAVLDDLGRAEARGLDHAATLDLLDARAPVLRDLRRWDEARRDFEALAKLRPQSAIPWINLAMIAGEGGKDELALRHLGRALSLEPGQIDALLNRALILRTLGRGEEARSDLLQALEGRRDLTHAQRSMGQHVLASIHADRGELSLAIEAQEIALREARAREDIADITGQWIYLANLLHSKGRIRECLTLIDELLAEQPRNVRALESRFQVTMGRSDFQGMNSTLRMAQQRLPDHPSTKRMQADLLRRSGRHAEGLQAAREGVQLAEANSQTWRSLRISEVMCLIGLGRHTEALELLEPLEEQVGNQRGSVLYLLFGLYRELGRIADARRAGEAFVKDAPRGHPSRIKVAQGLERLPKTAPERRR